FDGWQVIEERDGADKLIARYTYGSGIDERVRVQYLDDKGKFNTYIPLQDTIGNVIALTDEAGKEQEKYIYSTYGAPMFYCDDIPADTDNAFIMEGVITMQFTEPVKTESVNTAVKVMHNGQEVDGTFEPTSLRREFTFTPTNEIPQGEEVTLEIGKGIEDDAGNKSENVVSEKFICRDQFDVIYDVYNPGVEEIAQVSGVYLVTFSERINPAT
ncbi:MAG: Ig-like domain-containing protein, partial [bacterium]|nr:Ig-like domain-containing protein [bacterium]